MTDTHGTPTPGQVPPLPNTPAVRRALDEIATAVASGDIIDRILNSDEVIPEDPDDELKAWQLRSSVCLRGMVEGLKRFEERGGFTSSVPREQRLLLLWVNDSEHPEWMCEWAAELN